MTEETAEATPAPEAAPAPAPEGPAPGDYFGRALAALSSAVDETAPVVAEVDAPIEAPPAEASGDHDEMTTPAPSEGTTEATPPPAEVQPTVDHEAILRQISEQQRALEEARIRFEAERDAHQPNLEALRRAREARGADVVQALRDLGLDYSEVTRRILEKGQPATEAKAEVDLAPVKSEIEELRTQLQAYQRDAMHQQVSTAAREYIDSNDGEGRYSLLRAMPDYGKRVIDRIEADWKAKGSPRDPNTGHALGTLTLAQGADMLEQELFAEATRFSKIQKVRAHYAPPPPAEPPTETAPPATPGATPPAKVPEASTLTTTHASTAARANNVADAAACRARAIAVLEKIQSDT